MTMFEQARRCSFGLTKTFFSHSSKSVFSHHDNVRTSATLFVWLNENVRVVCLCKREQRPKRKETTPKQGRTTFKQERTTFKQERATCKQGGNNRTTERERYSRMNEQPHKLAVTSPKVEGTPHKQEETTYKQGGTPHKQERATCKQARATPQASGRNPTSKGEQPHNRTENAFFVKANGMHTPPLLTNASCGPCALVWF